MFCRSCNRALPPGEEIRLLVRRSISIWSLTSDLAHCFLKLVLSNVLTAVIQLQVSYIQFTSAVTRAPRRAEGSFGHTHNSVTSGTMIILREVLPTA